MMFLVSYFHSSRNGSGFGNVEIGVDANRLSLDQIREIESGLRSRNSYETAVVLNVIPVDA